MLVLTVNTLLDLLLTRVSISLGPRFSMIKGGLSLTRSKRDKAGDRAQLLLTQMDLIETEAHTFRTLYEQLVS